MNEAEFLQRLKPLIEARGSRIEKVHGNLYQSGLPDWLLIRPGSFAFCELKSLQQKEPTMRQLQSALRPEQRKNVAIWAHRYRCPVYVAAWTHKGPICIHGTVLPDLLETALPQPLADYALEWGEVADTLCGLEE